MRMLAGGFLALALAWLAVRLRRVADAGSCSDLAKMALPHATITVAASVQAGAFTPDAQSEAGDFTALPAFCRVAATLKPTSDSDIKIEVWLPASGWNGKFQAVGNGAFSGAIAYPAMGRALARGYAAASTDTGHVGNTASFALGHPGKTDRFRLAGGSRDDRRLEDDRGRAFRHRAEVLLLERLFRRRPAGDGRSPALPGGLRRHHRRRTWP